MFQDSLIIMTFFIMFGSFIKCNALPVHLLRQVQKQPSRGGVGGGGGGRLFLSVFLSIFGAKIGYFSVKKCAVFLTIF